MDSGPGNLDPSLKGLPVNLKPVISRPAKRRDERRMDIDNSVPIGLNHLRRQNHQKSCKHDQIRLKFPKPFQKRPVKFVPAFKAFGRNTKSRDICRFCSFQRISPRVIADDTGDPGVLDGTVSDSVNNGLQVGSSSGDTHYNV